MHILTSISRINEINTWHVCTLLNAFLMVIPNMGMKFQNCTILKQIVRLCCCRLYHGKCFIITTPRVLYNSLSLQKCIHKCAQGRGGGGGVLQSTTRGEPKGYR